MKVLVVSHSCVTPINQQLYAEVRRQTGWEISIVVPSNWRDEYGRRRTVERLPGFDGRLIGIPVWRPGDIILHAYRSSFARLIREENPDVVYVNHEPYAVATAQVFWGNRKAGRRPIGFYSCQNIHKRYPIPFRWTEATVLKSSRFSFPISKSVDDVFRRKGYVNASSVLPLAMDRTTYFPQPDREELHRSLSNGAPILIGYVGRFVKEKGLDTLLSAAALLKENSAWHMVWVGAGPEEQHLRQRAGELGLQGRLSFAGFVPHEQAPRYLSALDVLVLPSETQANWKEQFGRVILEAMACGTCVVGSDSGEIPTLIRQTAGGLVFAERDANALAEQLQKLINDEALRKQLAATGMAAVAQQFDLAVVSRQFIQTLSQVVG